MPAKKRSWPIWLVVLLLGAAAFGGWKWYSNRSQNKAVDFKTAVVARGDIVQAVTANGQLSPVRNVQVGSQVSGIIREILVDFNSHVTNGQVIAKIDPSTYDQNITQAQADLLNARAGLEYAQLSFNRARELRQNDLLSQSDYDKTVVDLHQAEAALTNRQAALNRAQVDLERTTIFSPVDGVVISRAVDVGQTVAASFNTPTLFQIATDLRKMRIEAMVSEADVGGVDEGQNVTFTVDAFPGRQFKGHVSQVRYAPITNQNVVSYVSVVDVENDDLKLRPGMTATASIITGEKRGVLRIPNTALRFRPPDQYLAKSATNAPSNSAKTTGPAPAAASPGGAVEGAGERPNREEMRRRFESMTPEQREEARKRWAERGGGPGGRGGGSGGGQRAGEGPQTRTVYVPEKTADGKTSLKAVAVKTGISDSSYTEVLDGLTEGQEIVTGINMPLAASTPGAPQGNSPFGGGFGGRR